MILTILLTILILTPELLALYVILKIIEGIKNLH
jgi:hypothetical protein